MVPRFKEDKTTQTAAILLELNGGSMNYMKLLKLLYLIDREALLTLGRPLTFDAYVSMDRGPVLSRTFNLINENVEPGQYSYWYDYISEPEHYSVSLKKEVPKDELSEAEIKLINKIFNEYKQYDQWALVDVVHKLPEWIDPKGSAIPIHYHDILAASGKTPSEIAVIEDELSSLAFVDEIT